MVTQRICRGDHAMEVVVGLAGALSSTTDGDDRAEHIGQAGSDDSDNYQLEAGPGFPDDNPKIIRGED